MARLPRNDTRGSWHHVTNRAIARRSMFEQSADIRFFLACTARAVRRRQIEVHAFCVLTTHFHMLVRSPEGELSHAMRRIQNEYVRHFNRTRRRDGPLVRGRFRSRPVDSLRYRQTLVRYIDDNPVQARLCSDPCDYRWGSAWWYARASGPRWLCREWVESWIAQQAGTNGYDPADYPRSLPARAGECVAGLVESRLRAKGRRDELDSLLDKAPPAVLAWLRQKAMLADGHVPDQPLVAAAAVSGAIRGLMAKHGGYCIRANRRRVDGWCILHVGLLRDLAGSSFSSIAGTLSVSPMQSRRFEQQHRRLLDGDEHYGCLAASAARDILAESFAFDLPAGAMR